MNSALIENANGSSPLATDNYSLISIHYTVGLDGSDRHDSSVFSKL